MLTGPKFGSMMIHDALGTHDQSIYESRLMEFGVEAVMRAFIPANMA